MKIIEDPQAHLHVGAGRLPDWPREEVVAFEIKTKQGKRGLPIEMQFARTLERRKAILDVGFELIECLERDFKRRPPYPKNPEIFSHVIVFDFEAMLHTSKNQQATNDPLFESEHVPVSVSFADTLGRSPEHISSKEPKDLI